MARDSKDTELVFTFWSLEALTFALWLKLYLVVLLEEDFQNRNPDSVFTVRLKDESDDASLDKDALRSSSELTSSEDSSYLHEEIYCVFQESGRISFYRVRKKALEGTFPRTFTSVPSGTVYSVSTVRYA